MDQSGFQLRWGEDLSLGLPLAGQAVIDASCPGQDFRYGSQPSAPPLNPGVAQAATTFPFQQQIFSQYSARESRFSFSSGDPQALLSQNHTPRDPLTTILTHPNVATHRDSISIYLRLPPGLWAELYKPQLSTPFHQELTGFLSQKYGKPPPDLWDLVYQLREQRDFQQSQDDFVDAILATVSPQAGASARERRSYGDGTTLDQSEETSPVLVISSAVPGQDSQTTATTPLPVGHPRSKSQSPYQRAKGRAPKDHRYKCPYTNCKHEPFRNAGNFNNHMRSCHFESEYRNQHPSDFLMPDLSPQPSIQGDGTSSAATNASDSPVSYRRPSQEYGTADWAHAQDRFRGIGEGAYHHAADEEFQAHMVHGLMVPGDLQEANVTSRLANSSIREDFGFGLTGRHPRSNNTSDDSSNGGPPFSPVGAGPVGFGDFQVLEKKRWDERRER